MPQAPSKISPRIFIAAYGTPGTSLSLRTAR
jgi:hypothetical protein